MTVYKKPQPDPYELLGRIRDSVGPQIELKQRGTRPDDPPMAADPVRMVHRYTFAHIGGEAVIELKGGEENLLFRAGGVFDRIGRCETNDMSFLVELYKALGLFLEARNAL